MENGVNDKLTSYNVVDEFISIAENQALITAVPDAVTEFNEFHDIMPELVTALKFQSKPTKGLKDESILALDVMANELIRLGRKASVLAKKAGKLDLAKQILHPAYYIKKPAMNLILERALNWRDALDINKGPGGVLTNITAAEITTLDAYIKDFKNKCVKPKAAKKEKKVKGTDLVPGYISKIDEILNNAYNLLYGEYINDKPVFVEGLYKAIDVDKSGIRHTGVTVFASYVNPPAGLPINAVKDLEVKMVEPNVVRFTNCYGVACFSGIVPDTYTLQLTGVGLEPQTIVVNLKKGHILQLDVKMKRIV